MFEYFKLNGGPWDLLCDEEPFIEGVPSKPKGANFYPQDMTLNEWNEWLKTLSKEDQKDATGFFHVIQRKQDGTLTTIPYNQHYKLTLEKASLLLEEASHLVLNSSMSIFLSKRAKALISNEYQESDAAWVDVDEDSVLDVTFGPYEVYEDSLLNQKASFESFIALRDFENTQNIKQYSNYLQFIENQLPIDDKYKNKKIGESESPLVTVDLLYSSGDVCGPQTVAFCLPNDEVVVAQKGSKRVMLK